MRLLTHFALILLSISQWAFCSISYPDILLLEVLKNQSITHQIKPVIGFFGVELEKEFITSCFCQEIVENPMETEAFLLDQLQSIVRKETGRLNGDRSPCLEVPSLCQPFQLYYLYDWVICLENPSSVYENSEVFWDNVTRHASKGVIILSPSSPNQVISQLKNRRFIPDPNKQKALRQVSTRPNFKNLMVFQNTNPKIFLLSYIRSGSTWLNNSVRGMIENTTFSFFNKELRFTNYRETDSREIPLTHMIKLHDPQVLAAQSSPSLNDLLIVIVRNYFEAFKSGYEVCHKTTATFDAVYRNLIKTKDSQYFQILRLYDTWDPDKRFLVYYEDLISDFYGEMKKLTAFLNIPPANLEAFMENYENERQISLESYHANHRLKSDGEDPFYHTRAVPVDQLYSMENYIKKKYPYLWDKYLSRYAVENRMID